MNERPWILRVRSGKRLHAHAVISPGEALRVGHGAPSEFAIPSDRSLGLVHFTLHNEGGTCTLVDGGTPEGTQVDGRRVTSPALSHGAWLRAGETDFSIYREASTPPLDEPQETAEKRAALAGLAALRTEGEGLFGLFDSARDMRILELLRESIEEVASLYEGMAGEAMADAAPYIVSFPAREEPSLLSRLVHEGWGQSWGVFLTSARPLADVRRHLRRFLIVKDDTTEERLYFRYYDPRVLRVFLPTCSARQRAELFGEVSRFLVEAEDGQLVTFEKGATRGGT